MSTGEELFIGLAGATGTDLGSVTTLLSENLKDFGFETIPIKFSRFFDESYFTQKAFCNGYTYYGVRLSTV